MALTMCVCSGRFRLKGLQAICQAVSHFLHALPLVSNPMPLAARARRRSTAMTEGTLFSNSAQHAGAHIASHGY